MIKHPHKTTSLTDYVDQTELAKLKAIIFNSPESEHAKIQLIKEELATGRYTINSQHLADKLLEFSPVLEDADLAMDCIA